eukprot:TRINITY_DN34875_c0_g1_i1.p1 TRINITY_DN34875_c0_g1~~TRINITY_DN34875_c0_g1_i1.p1  ORF type:complete len:594 (+),score=90.49 TRINITY_DN34875_c0_g1_i1:40-1821(+)
MYGMFSPRGGAEAKERVSDGQVGMPFTKDGGASDDVRAELRALREAVERLQLTISDNATQVTPQPPCRQRTWSFSRKSGNFSRPSCQSRSSVTKAAKGSRGTTIQPSGASDTLLRAKKRARLPKLKKSICPQKHLNDDLDQDSYSMLAPTTARSWHPLVDEAELVPNTEVIREDVSSDLPDYPQEIAPDGYAYSAEQAVWVEIVESERFEHFCGFLVMVNSLAIGLQTDYRVMHGKKEGAGIDFIDILDAFFCALFSCELMMRMYAYRGRFFSVDGWAWHLFDTVVVALQIFEELISVFSFLEFPFGAGFFTTIRLLRAVRIARLVRLFHLFQELRTIVYSIVKSFVSLFWTLLLLFLLIYGFSVIFLQVVMTNLPDEGEGPVEVDGKDLRYWFGGLGRTMLTLFEVIVGGSNWDTLIIKLTNEIGICTGLCFCFYIAFALFVMLNVVTGVFVDTAMNVAKEEADLQVATNLCELFFEKGSTSSSLTDQDFQDKLDSPTLQAFMKSIDVDINSAHELFALYDEDDSGSVDAEEMVKGFLRLRGSARSLDLCILMQRQKEMDAKVTEFMEGASFQLWNISNEVATIRRDHASTT